MKRKTLAALLGKRRFGMGIAQNQKGQALVFVLLTMVLGAMLTGSFISYLSASFSANRKNTDQLWTYYATDAGVKAVVKDLLQGADALSPDYTVPSVTVNDYSATINIVAPNPAAVPTAAYQYIDPGASQGLSSLSSLSHYYFQMNNVQAGSNIRVNWSFTPIVGPWKIALYTGSGPGGASPPTIIAADDFESSNWSGGSGWLYDWSRSGSVSIVTTDSPHEGIYHLQLRSSSDYAARAVDLSGRTNVRVQFWAKANSFEAGEYAQLLVSPNGTTWTAVRTWIDGEDDNLYRFEDMSLSSFAMTSEFWIAFQASMGDTADYLWIDDLKIVSQLVTPPIAENRDIRGPGTLDVSGGLITGGVYTIDFYNNSGVSLASASYSSIGDTSSTWVYIKAYKDYLIRSQTDGNTLVVYARQVPGPTVPTTRQTVAIETWQGP